MLTAFARTTLRLTAVLAGVLPVVANAQSFGDGSTSLSAVLAEAQKNYPAVRISQEELNASAARLALARTAYLPRLDGLAQFNRGTRNNVFGPLLPQSIVPSMSGPVIGTNNGGSVWGSGAGLLVNWQPFDFGVRHANVIAAASARDKAKASGQRTELEVAAASADAYLTELAAGSIRTAAAAAVESWQTLETSTHALVAAQLRPGADESRIEAERAAAVNQLALAEEASEVSRATLIRFAPQAGTSAPGAAHFLTDLPDLTSVDRPFVPAQNPIIAEQEATVKQNAAQLHAVERSWVPQFSLEGAGYARGTGAETNGQRLAGANGLGPNTGNYVAGVNVTFPFLDFASVQARRSEQAANLRMSEGAEDLASRSLREQFSQALARVKATVAVAGNTPVEVKAARTAFEQARARYKAGLAPIDNLAQAQRLLVQAQMDDAIARLSVWRAWLHLQFVRGDLQPFLDQALR